MWSNQKNWDKMTVLILCQIEDLETKKRILQDAGITLPEILERVSIWREIWKQDNLNGHDLRPLKLPISTWLENHTDVIKEKVLSALSTMKINYVFQIYAFRLAPKYPFLEEFGKHFSTREEIDGAIDFLEKVRKSSKLPPIKSVVWMEEDLFWVKKTWGL